MEVSYRHNANNDTASGSTYNNYIINVIDETNSIYFNGDIDSNSMEDLINKLNKMELNIKNKKKKLDNIIKNAKSQIDDDDELKAYGIDLTTKDININLYITSNGGNIYDVFGTIDIIKSLSIPVHTICKGCVASAGTLLSLAGKKKLIFENSYMLIHELRTSCWGKFTYVSDNYNNSHQLMKHIKSYYIKNAKNINAEELEEQLKKDIMWDSHTCLEKGFVDEIIFT